MPKKSCEFCERIERSNKLFQFWESRLEESAKRKQVISVAFVERSWKRDEPYKNFDRTTDYHYRGFGFRLNYCPTCGRKIKKSEVVTK